MSSSGPPNDRHAHVAACTCGWPEKECLRRVLGNGPPFPPEPCEPKLGADPVKETASSAARGSDTPTGVGPEVSAAQDRELRLRTIKGVVDLLRSAGSMSPERDAISVESNGYAAWFVPYDPKPMSTAAISNEEILRRIEAREALKDG